MLTATVTAIVMRRRLPLAMRASMPASSRSRSAPSVCERCSVPNDSRALAVGISVIATSIEARIEADMAMATSE